ncbi:hypothetical protein PROFUN_02919 [Planoprotostelium fungivorum]|uniref:Protein kinase domain-containing protein n=1 Tax=Planoprotostelium fungivorum TaxID=1890364 RepID=A0A2P6NS67_9EUKA|nr:hypothetical protein PROFUN_02919 [Planoprotostelium fungivorum]
MSSESEKSHKPQRKRRRHSTPIPDWDDSERHYRVILGESLTSRFKVMRLLGEGTFGKVVECWDRKRKRYVAVKIIRAVDRYREAAFTEMDILNDIADGDPSGRSGCVTLLTWFDFRGHLCMVFERWGPCLYDVIKNNRYQPFPIYIIRSFARQLCHSIAYLHSINLIHTDLKPENILLEDDQFRVLPPDQNSTHPLHLPVRPNIVLIDFGGATFNDKHHTSIVSTRHYRAPEVILDLGWTFPCDVWSIGCILVEFYTGTALFQTHRNAEHLAIMEKVLGPLPHEMIQKSKYYQDGELKWMDSANPSSLKYVESCSPMPDMIHDEDFLDLILKMLTYDTKKRITAREALRHPFLNCN